MKRTITAKTIAFVLLLAIVATITLTACGYDDSEYNETQERLNEEILKVTEINKHLYYDVNTKIVYMIMAKSEHTQYCSGYMSVYYSENGLLYKYDEINKVLVELDKQP